MDNNLKFGKKLKNRLANAIAVTVPACRVGLVQQLNSMVKYTEQHPDRCDYKVIRTVKSTYPPRQHSLTLMPITKPRKFARYEFIVGTLVLDIWIEKNIVKTSYFIRTQVPCDPVIVDGAKREHIFQLGEYTDLAENGAETMAGVFSMIFIDGFDAVKAARDVTYFEAFHSEKVPLNAVAESAWEKLVKGAVIIPPGENPVVGRITVDENGALESFSPGSDVIDPDILVTFAPLEDLMGIHAITSRARELSDVIPPSYGDTPK